MSRSQFHVVPENDRWKVEWYGHHSTDHESQADAVEAAVAEADKTRPAEVIVHGSDGRITDEMTYDSEPPPPSG